MSERVELEPARRYLTSLPKLQQQKRALSGLVGAQELSQFSFSLATHWDIHPLALYVIVCLLQIRIRNQNFLPFGMSVV